MLFFLFRVLASALAVFCYGLTNSTPKKLLIYPAINGGICWLIYLIAYEMTESVPLASFFATLAVALYSHMMARIRKTPVTLYFLGGILPLVPGSQIYRTAYGFLLGDREMMWENLTLTIMIAGAVALGIFVMDSLFQIGKRFSVRQKESRQ